MDTEPTASPSVYPLTPEVVDAVAPDSTQDVAEHSPDTSESVSQPTKLIRIATMVRSMLEEVRRAPLDDAGRRMLAQVHAKSLRELEDILSPDLKAELAEVALPFASDAPSESELRIAQAQLVGWLEGLFHGIQATLFTQQSMAAQQFEQMRRQRALEPGQPTSESTVHTPMGVYL